MRKVIIITWVYSIIGVLTFLVMEHVLNFIPCHLCKVQRIPYYIAAGTGFFIKRQSTLILNIIFIILFSAALYISIFHFLVEEKFVLYSCFSSSESLEIEAIRNSLKNSPPSCTTKFYFAGIRLTIILTGVNLLILTINLIDAIKKYRLKIKLF